MGKHYSTAVKVLAIPSYNPISTEDHFNWIISDTLHKTWSNKFQDTHLVSYIHIIIAIVKRTLTSHDCKNVWGIHHSSLSFTSPVTNITYPLHTHATYSSSNLIYLLTCTQCDSFYVDETKNSLSTKMNGHRSSTNSPDDLLLPVAIHTRSHHLPFNSCWNVRVFHNLPPNTDHITSPFPRGL
jgi:hypothetical protein